MAEKLATFKKSSNLTNVTNLQNTKIISKIHFITFGGPDNDLHNAVNRICKQAKQFELFETITGYTEQDLINDKEFWNSHGNFITNNKRGNGYWIWKPYLILKKLGQIADDDILLYLDCGCELNVKGIGRFYQMIEKTYEMKIIGTSTVSNDVFWSKKSLITHLQMDSHPLLKQKHMQAGAVMMKKCAEIINLYDEFYKIAHNYSFIDDSPSTIPNPRGFQEHRHDQSIFNLLVKKYNLINYHMDPTEWGFFYKSRANYISKAMEYPIWTCRNKFGKSLLE